MGLWLSNYQHSLWKTIAVCLFIPFLQHVQAQSEAACPIMNNQNPGLIESFRLASETSQEKNFGYAAWDGLDYVYKEDGQTANTTLIPWNRSYRFKVSNFGFNIPAAAYVEGIRVILRGYSLGDGRVSDHEIYLLDQNGNQKGINKANKNFNGFKWPHRDSTDHYEWNYGYSADLWEGDWNPANINDKDFGVNMQFVNLTPDSMELYLDQVSIQVYYREPRLHCEKECLPYFVLEQAGAVDYIWQSPPGFTEHPDAGGAKNVINLVPDTAPFGAYELCVQTVYPTTISPACCMKFEYANCEPGSIGDFVFEDKNGNGIHENTENAMEGIKVKLYKGSLSDLAVSYSDSQGYYSFQNLPRGEYYVGIELPEDYGAAPQESLAGDFIDLASNTIILDFGEQRNDLDFGVYKYGIFSGFVWKDNNADGIRSIDDLAMSTQVYLYDTNDELVEQTISDTLGFYHFNKVIPGNYYLKFESPDPSYGATLRNASNDEALDSDIFEDNGEYKTDLFTVMSGSYMKNVDAGFVQKTGTIKGMLWEDLNGDGLSSSEPVLGDFSVELWNCNGGLAQTILTDDQGMFTFINVNSGMEYYISITTPDSYGVIGPVNDNTLDSTGRSECTLLLPLDTLFLNGAITPLSSVGDFIWLDDNRDGIQDADETGIDGVHVELINSNGDLVGSAISDGAGAYVLNEIFPGDYFLRVADIPDSLELSAPDNATDDIDSDFEDVMGDKRTQEFSVFPGTDNFDMDCGLSVKTSTISGMVWRDNNGDGFLQASEKGMEAIEVSLFTCDDNLIQSVLSDAEGDYLFTSLIPSLDYYIHFDKTDEYAYSFDPGDTDINHQNGEGTTACFEIEPGEELFKNGGLAPYGSVGDYVWLDLNKNGIQDIDEPGIENVEITLRDVFKATVDQISTDENGLYVFTELYPAQYSLAIKNMDDIYELTEFDAIPSGDNVSKFFEEDSIARTYTFDLFNGKNRDNIDAGLTMKTGLVSGYVWDDGNGDGFIQDDEEPFPYFEMSLWECNSGMLAQTGSGTDGLYRFDNVEPLNEYYVKFEIPDGYAYSFAPGDTDVTHANGEGTTDCFLVEPNSTTEANAAYAPLGSIGDYIWLDQNRDGIQDADEPGIEGVEVILRDVFLNPQEIATTDSEGKFLFDMVYPARYSLALNNVNDDLELTEFNVISGSPLVSKFFYEDSIARTFSFMIYNGKQKDNLDAGLRVKTGSISGNVWQDINGDGVMGVMESALNLINVTLYSCNNEFTDETLTDSNGNYSFSDIPSNREYYIVVELLPGFDFSRTHIDSHITSANGDGSSDCFLMTNGSTIMVNAGLAPFSKAGDYVWFDEDNNGLQDAGESGISGAEVRMYDSNDELIFSTITDDEGKYLISKIYPGSYYFNLVLENDDLVPTEYQLGTNETNSDFRFQISGISTELYQFENGYEDFDIDAGLSVRSIAISGAVWRDSNGNGERGSSETGINGMEVQLFNCNGSLVESTMTAGDGNYSFFNMELTSEYYVRVIYDETHFAESIIGFDSNITSSNGVGTTDCLLGAQFDNSDFLLGLAPLGVVGDFIWIDENENGLQDLNESGLQDVEISLYNSDDQFLATTFSDQAGFYVIDKIYPGSYYLTISSYPEQMEFSAYQQMTNEELDSDFDFINGQYRTELFLLKDGANFLSIDAGLISTVGSISGLVFEDMNADGQRSDSDLLLSNQSVALYDQDGNLLEEKQTGSNGAYQFDNLDSGAYYIAFKTDSNLIFSEANVVNEALDSDVTGFFTSNSTDLIDLAPKQNLRNIDAGVYRKATMGDFVWADENGNGIQDDSERGIEGIMIEIYDEDDNLIDSYISDLNGHYEFQVTPGLYSLFMIAGDEYRFTEQAQGSDTSIDSDFVSSNGIFGVALAIDILSGEKKLDIDAGLVPEPIIMESSISGRVWEDLNGNGLINSESGTDGVRVVLINNMGLLIDETTSYSDPDFGSGYYHFLAIPNGSYLVEFQIMGAPIPTTAHVGNDATQNSVIMEDNGVYKTEFISLDDFTGEVFVNAGYYHYISIGDYVWNDFNDNGIQDIDEEGINDFLVRIYDLNNKLVDIQTTKYDVVSNRKGYYLFDDLAPGSYYILINLQEGVFISEANQGNNSAFDSDITHANGLNTSNVIVLQSGKSNYNVDIGLTQTPGTIGSKLWEDINGNGVQDSGEPGLNNIEVQLYTENYDFVKSTFTKYNSEEGDGFYIFVDVQPGNYYVQFILPSEYLTTLSDKGGDDSRDSDITNMIDFGTTDIFNLDAAENYPDLDGGVFLPSSIGDFVWNDINKNGLQDQDEKGLAGVEIELIKPIEDLKISTLTDDEGYYSFSDLRPGNYILNVITPDNFAVSSSFVGDDMNLDSDVDINGVIAELSLKYNSQRKDVDAGLYMAQTVIGDLVWFDENSNGLQDFNEIGMEGIEINLLDENKELVNSIFTNVLGEYRFVDMNEGDYFIQFIAPEGFEYTQKSAGFDIFLDSNVDEEGLSDKYYLFDGIYLPDIDAGLKVEGSIIGSQQDDDGLTFKGAHKEQYNELKWTDIIACQSCEYLIYRSVAGADQELIHRSLTAEEINSFEMKDRDLIRGGIYTYFLFKKDQRGIILDSKELELYVPYYKFKVTKISPNPLLDFMKIEANGSNEQIGTIDIKVLDGSGNLVLDSKITAGEYINMNILPAGIYNVILDTGEQKDVHQIIKL